MAIVNGTPNSDTLNAADGVTNGADDIYGFGGDDIIDGLGGNDNIFGGSGIDILKGGGGEDTLTGGSENDTLYGGSSNDYLFGQGGNDTLDGGSENDYLFGQSGNDTLNGGSENDTLFGQGDKDTLKGGDGHDLLDGGDGIDDMRGGLGNDTYIVDDVEDHVFEGSAEGNDTVKASVSYNLGYEENVETLRTTDDNGTDAINLRGSDGAETLIGNAGVNILNGGINTDTMRGLAGNDVYFVNEYADKVFESANQGADTVRSEYGYALAAGQEVEALTTTNNNGVKAINLSGNGATQTIVGNAGVNVLQGFGGDDQLQGMAGNDTLTGGTGNDKFLFNTALNAATNVDTITDMTAGVDIIRLDDAFFAGIGAVGVLNADAFHIGAAAADAEDRIVYNSATGQLFFDANGNAAGGSTLFANLSNGLALSNTDFYVV